MADRWTPPPMGPYQYYEVISALRKSIKIKNHEDTIYWVNVICTYVEKGAPKMVAKQLWIMAAEDLHDPFIVQWAHAVYMMADKVPESDHVYFLAYAMCDAEGWWETEYGRRWNHLWSKAIGDLKRSPKPIPDYAVDRHTSRGKAWLTKAREVFAERFGRKPTEVEEWGDHDRYSGTDVGQQKTLWAWLKYGRLDPSDPIDYAEFEEFYEQRRQLEARGTKTPPADGQDELL